MNASDEIFSSKEIYVLWCRLVGAKEKLAEAWMMVGISHGEAGNVNVTSLSFVLTEQLEIRDFGLVCASSSRRSSELRVGNLLIIFRVPSRISQLFGTWARNFFSSTASL